MSDPCDPGGRLGPYLDYGQPDVRNLAMCCVRYDLFVNIKFNIIIN